MAFFVGVKKITLLEWLFLLLGLSLLFWVMVASLPMSANKVFMPTFALALIGLMAFLKASIHDQDETSVIDLSAILHDLTLFDDQILALTDQKGRMISCSHGYKRYFDRDLPSPKQFLSDEQHLSGSDKDQRDTAIQCQFDDKIFSVKRRQAGQYVLYSLTPDLFSNENTDSEALTSLSGDKFFDLLRSAPISILTLNKKGDIHRYNETFSKLLSSYGGLDLKKSVATGAFHEFFLRQEQEDIKKGMVKAFDGKIRTVPWEVHFKETPDNVLKIYMREFPIADGDEILVFMVDTTELKEMETQFVQAQKMQAVGQLAGGVAHDFNNLLTAITGFCDLLLQRHGPGDSSFGDLMQIKQNSNRAANLVRQLLAFSRRQTLRPQVLDIGDVLSDISNLVRRLIGEKVKFDIIHGRNVPKVKADVGQLEQVFINLSVNARDAMPGGGELTFKTGTIDKADVANLGYPVMTVDDYVHIAIKDTGTGMSLEVQQQIFEPFFTTKKVGEGTGLGLSTVYGIVKQTGGFVFADSVVGEGTTFNIYLPVYHAEEAELENKQTTEVIHKDLTGKETILLVEDEAPVRLFAKRALENKGYEVLIADCGEAALEVLDEHEGPIDLLISDVIMPGLDGPSLARQIVKISPDIKIIFISGYAEEEYRDQLAEFDCSFLPKPFSLVNLAETVKDTLDT